MSAISSRFPVRSAVSAVRFIIDLTLIATFLVGFGLQAQAQTDPGPRPGPSDAGGPYSKLNDQEQKLFWAGWAKFKEVVSVSGAIENERGVGLGPTFNGNSCAACHSQPAAGGSSPGPRSPQVRQLAYKGGRLGLARQNNPQVGLATLDRVAGGDQVVPPFISADGPIRVARFITKPDGTLDGNVHDIYTIAGRGDAPGCVMAQPDFKRETASGNVVFRIPIPVFGDGLIEAVPDATLIANLNSTATQRRALGIGGRFNRSANDGTITRLGWKAQDESLLIFGAESYNVEIGGTSEIYPNKRDGIASCVFNPLPEDKIRMGAAVSGTYPPASYASDVNNFANFMELLGPPTPTTHSPSELRGKALFSKLGCAMCHSPNLTTGSSAFTGMSHIVVHPYSDYALHHMGPGLADHVCQGLATGDEFRTAPLWGLGQRLFFLHDGRTSELLVAIEDHASTASRMQPRPRLTCGHEAPQSEATQVIRRFNALSPSEKQDLLNFLRSL